METTLTNDARQQAVRIGAWLDEQDIPRAVAARQIGYEGAGKEEYVRQVLRGTTTSRPIVDALLAEFPEAA